MILRRWRCIRFALARAQSIKVPAFLGKSERSLHSQTAERSVARLTLSFATEPAGVPSLGLVRDMLAFAISADSGVRWLVGFKVSIWWCW